MGRSNNFMERDRCWNVCMKADNEPEGVEIYANTEANARKKMINYLIAEGIITTL